MSALFRKIELKDVSIAFEGEPPILKSVSGKIPVGEFCLLKSESGGGKSTFLKILAGILMPQEGSLNFNDDDISEMTFEEFLKYRIHIGYGFDFGGLIANKSLYENLILPLQYHNQLTHPERKDRVMSLFKKFKIDQFSHKRPAMVIGGVRKLACQLRAMILNPELVLLDDPLTGLGPDVQHLFHEYIFEYRMSHPDTTFIFTGRSGGILQDLVTHTLSIENGSIVGLENVDTVKEERAA